MPIRLPAAFILCVCATALLLAAGQAAAALPVRAERVLSGLDAPVDFAGSPDRPRDLFVVEQGGRIRIARDGALLAAPLLDLTSVVASGGERGLLGLALHPQFGANGRFFVDYTRAGDGATVIASFTTRAGDPDRADPASRRELLIVAQPFENHNGGALRFGPDGYLYIGMGDGGSGNDPGNRAQNPQELLGKILRIDVDAAAPYGIPPGNPYAAGGGRAEIFASGVRNPWRFSFDRATGDFYLGDVGQDVQEEIDFLPALTGAGTNFGWRAVEGTRCTGLSGGVPCPSAAFAPPILTYDHGEGCSVTGGIVYRGRGVPVLFGRYVYGDFCSGRLWSAARDADGVWRSELLLQTGHQVAAIGADAQGELYWSDLRTGDVHRLVADATVPVTIEFFNAGNGHYFLTAFASEAAFLEAGAFAGAWQRTGYGFAVATPLEDGVVDVCRFLGAPGSGLDTHFYTGDAAECAALKANPRWIFESVGFRARVPAADACPSNTRPVYRFYSNPAALAGVNHRFTTDGTVHAQMRAAGWLAEGVAFCAK